jgi:ABC-2 type transport system ATP-binding protein
MSTLLEAKNLTKHVHDPWTFRRITLLDDLNLALAHDEIFGLIGPNGAGKTTTLKLIVGLLRPSRGTVLFEGRPLDVAARAAIGFLPEQPYFYDYLTVEETLTFFARLYGLSRADRRDRVSGLLRDLHLHEKRNAPMRTLSKGTLQRVGIAQAMLARPRLLILDEPMSGLDPAGRAHMRDLIRGLRGVGTTVVFSSHVLPDAEAVCDRVGIIACGRLREIVPLKGEAEPGAYLLSVRRMTAEAIAALQRVAGGPAAADGETWSIRLPGRDAVRTAVDTVHAADGVIESLMPLRPSLEERFLAWVKPEARLD